MPRVSRSARFILPVGAIAASVVLASCGASDSTAAATADDRPVVLASFYPLQFATERVAGDLATVQGLTPAGAEAHDLELSPRDVAELGDADLVVYLAGFQPAVDEAVAQQAADTAVDVTESASLDLTAEDDGHDHGHDEGEAHEDEHDDEEHAGDDHADEDHADEEHAGEDHAETAVDPHFWLDPTRLADVGDAVAERLAADDPDNAGTYQANAETLRNDLTDLDTEFETGLADCANRDLVTSHQAFGYLAERYDLEQIGISGLSTSDEPSPAQLAEVTDFVRERDVSTIYFETLVSPDVAQTVADETGAGTATLDPLEGLTEDSEGADYLEVMRSNLTTLTAGQSCS